MPKYKYCPICGVTMLLLNGVWLAEDVRCHKHNPDCNYQFEAASILTSTASDSGVIYQPPAALRST
jgi:hypothetical protein